MCVLIDAKANMPECISAIGTKLLTNDPPNSFI